LAIHCSLSTDQPSVRFYRIFGEILAGLQDTREVTHQRSGLRAAGILFGLVMIAHLLRIFLGVDVQIGGRVMAMWPSWVAAVITGALAIWMWRLAAQRP
jgi:hypothetical protein